MAIWTTCKLSMKTQHSEKTHEDQQRKPSSKKRHEDKGIKRQKKENETSVKRARQIEATVHFDPKHLSREILER